MRVSKACSRISEMVRNVTLKNIKTILLYELNLRGCSTSTTLLIAGCLTLLTICIFFVGRFLDTNLASLSLQWTFLPWLLVFFLPAFGMRAFGSKKASSDMNLLLSYPFLPIEIIVGKWLSGLIILSQVLFLTFPMTLTISLLGDPDWGTVVSGYVGAVLVLALMYSVAILASDRAPPMGGVGEGPARSYRRPGAYHKDGKVPLYS